MSGNEFVFPQPATASKEKRPKGIRLRDWFAGQAMQAMICDPRQVRVFTPKEIAKRAYEQAEAMLDTR